MSNFALFICGIVVTLIVGMGVITSQIFISYKNITKSNNQKLELAKEING